MAELDRKGVTQRDYSDRAWTSLDHECAVRESGRAYRPCKVYDRPKVSERPGCNPTNRAEESK